eukprot:857801-Prorocentrum_lima.AAC.1
MPDAFGKSLENLRTPEPDECELVLAIFYHPWHLAKASGGDAYFRKLLTTHISSETVRRHSSQRAMASGGAIQRQGAHAGHEHLGHDQ